MTGSTIPAVIPSSTAPPPRTPCAVQRQVLRVAQLQPSHALTVYGLAAVDNRGRIAFAAQPCTTPTPTQCSGRRVASVAFRAYGELRAQTSRPGESSRAGDCRA